MTEHGAWSRHLGCHTDKEGDDPIIRAGIGMSPFLSRSLVQTPGRITGPRPKAEATLEHSPSPGHASLHPCYSLRCLVGAALDDRKRLARVGGEGRGVRVSFERCCAVLRWERESDSVDGSSSSCLLSADVYRPVSRALRE